jgi:hypothetical protein
VIIRSYSFMRNIIADAVKKRSARIGSVLCISRFIYASFIRFTHRKWILNDRLKYASSCMTQDAKIVD